MQLDASSRRSTLVNPASPSWLPRIRIDVTSRMSANAASAMLRGPWSRNSSPGDDMMPQAERAKTEALAATARLDGAVCMRPPWCVSRLFDQSHAGNVRELRI